MSRESVEAFLWGLGAGVLFACFLKPFEEPADAPRPAPKALDRPQVLAAGHK